MPGQMIPASTFKPDVPTASTPNSDFGQFLVLGNRTAKADAGQSDPKAVREEADIPPTTNVRSSIG